MILVTGATGHVGQEVVRALRKLRQPVRALVRKGSEYYWLNDSGCQFFFGDLRDPVSLSRACRDVRFIVVASGVRLESSENHHTNVTLDGHAALFEAARARGVERVVLLSCLGVGRGYPVPGFDARRGVEELLVDSGLEYTVLRSAAHERFFLDLAFAVENQGRTLLPARGDNKLNPIAAQDLALAAAASLDLDSVRNKIIDIGGPVEMSAREAYDAACDAIGVQPKATVLPTPLVKLGRAMGRPFRRYAHRIGEVATWFTDDFTVDPQTVTDTFGFPLTPLADALATTGEVMRAMRDPEQRDKRMVHPQFYATIYEPGEAKLGDLPDGPPPRRD